MNSLVSDDSARAKAMRKSVSPVWRRASFGLGASWLLACGSTHADSSPATSGNEDASTTSRDAGSSLPTNGDASADAGALPTTADAGINDGSVTPPADAAPPSTLKQAGALRRVLVGVAVDADELSVPITDPEYEATLGAEYSLLEPENDMKWGVIGAQQGVYNFAPGDSIVSFARAHHMKIRGHNLCWNSDNPPWLENMSSSALYQTLQAYIAAVVGHYKGSLLAWDVVNEAISDQAGTTGTLLKDSLWYNTPGVGLSGTAFVEQAFRWARAADPGALLFYNDYGIEVTGNKSTALINMLTDFKSRGVPIDGIGLEMHVDTTTDYPTSFPAALPGLYRPRLPGAHHGDGRAVTRGWQRGGHAGQPRGAGEDVRFRREHLSKESSLHGIRHLGFYGQALVDPELFSGIRSGFAVRCRVRKKARIHCHLVGIFRVNAARRAC